jgi:hypothetical protein
VWLHITVHYLSFSLSPSLTHTHTHTVKSLLSLLGSGFNGGHSPSYGFLKCTQPQLPASNSKITQLMSLNSFETLIGHAYYISTWTAQKTSLVLLYSLVAVEVCLFAETLLSSRSFTVAYFAVGPTTGSICHNANTGLKEMQLRVFVNTIIIPRFSWKARNILIEWFTFVYKEALSSMEVLNPCVSTFLSTHTLSRPCQLFRLFCTCFVLLLLCKDSLIPFQLWTGAKIETFREYVECA